MQQGLYPQDMTLEWMRYFGLAPPEPVAAAPMNPGMGLNPDSMPDAPGNPWAGFEPLARPDGAIPPMPQMAPERPMLRGRPVGPMAADSSRASPQMTADPAGMVTRAPVEPSYQMAGPKPQTMTDEDVRAYLGMPPAGGGATVAAPAAPQEPPMPPQAQGPQIPEASFLKDADSSTEASPFGGADEIRKFYGEAVQDDREKEDNRLYALRAIAEGMGNVGRAFTNYGRTIAGMPEEPPYIAEGIREKQAELQENLTPAEAEMMNLPPGTPRKQAGALLAQRHDVDEGAKLRKEIADATNKSREYVATIRTSEAAKVRERIEKFAHSRDLQQALKKEREEWFDPNSDIGKLQNAIRSSAVIESLINTKGPVAGRTAMVKLAKELAGDTGPLSEEDINAYQGDVGIQAFWNRLQQLIKGDLSAFQYSELKRVTDILTRTARLKYDDIALRRLESFGSLWREHLQESDKSEDDLPSLFGAMPIDDEATPGRAPEEPTSDVRYRKVRRSDVEAIRYAKEHGIHIEIDEDA